MGKHLYEFDSSGFYAAESREAAIALVMSNLHYAREDAEEDFLRDVPDDEVIKSISEEPWDHPREVAEERVWTTSGKKYMVYSLELTAAEHAAENASDWGYCFGGEQ